MIKEKQTPRQNLMKHPASIHLLKYQRFYIPLIIIILLLIPIIANHALNEPLIQQGESYYFISHQGNWTPWHAITNTFSLTALAWFPLLFALISVGLFYHCTKKWKVSKEVTFFFLFLLILTPSFLFTYSTIAMYSLITLLMLMGLSLTSSKKISLQILAIIPFSLIAFFDLYTTFLLILLQIFILIKPTKNKKTKTVRSFYIVMSVLLLIITGTILNYPWTTGPFNLTSPGTSLISDLGGLNGVSFFLILLGLIGFTFAWKNKRNIFAYVFVSISLLAYFFDPSTIFVLTLSIVFLASNAFIKLCKNKWTLVSLKKFTLLLLLLGLLFSTLTYLERQPAFGPDSAEKEALLWIKTNTPENAVILAHPDDSYYIASIAERKFITAPHWNQDSIFTQITEATYIEELFPLLENLQVTHLYLTPKTRKELTEEQGLLFLLINENFKLTYKHQDVEVWTFAKNGVITE